MATATIVKTCGLYIIKDQYFKDFSNDFLLDNKQEARPYYLAIEGDNGIFWMVPISHRVEKYRKKIQKDEERYHRKSIFAYIAKLKGEDRAFLTGQVIPVSEEYIRREFTIAGIPYVIANKSDIKEIDTRVKRYLAMIRDGKLTSNVNILEIEKQLLSKK